MAQPTQHFGTIKKVVRDKGFGFLQGANGTEYFFHRSACADFERVFEGAAVRFVEGQAGPKGPRADRVELMA